MLRSMVISALLVAFWAVPPRAHACKCRPLPVAEAASSARAVFEGRVVAIEAPKEENGDARVQLAVVRAWKGLHTEETLWIETRSEPAACGYVFVADESYLVYAEGESNDALRVHSCSRTQPVAEASEDLQVLGMGSVPNSPPKTPELTATAAPANEPPGRGGCASCSVGAATPGAQGRELGLAAAGARFAPVNVSRRGSR